MCAHISARNISESLKEVLEALPHDGTRQILDYNAVTHAVGLHSIPAICHLRPCAISTSVHIPPRSWHTHLPDTTHVPRSCPTRCRPVCSSSHCCHACCVGCVMLLGVNNGIMSGADAENHAHTHCAWPRVVLQWLSKNAIHSVCVREIGGRGDRVSMRRRDG